MNWFLGIINDLIFKVSLDDLVWMLNQVDQEFLATRVEEEKEEKKGYLESLVWKVKAECQELKDLKESQAHLYVYNRSIFMIDIFSLLRSFKCFTIFCMSIFWSQGIGGLPGEKADKGSKGEAGLNVS